MADDVFAVPPADEILAPMLGVIPLQLLSYYVGVAKRYDVDKPRNLGKECNSRINVLDPRGLEENASKHHYLNDRNNILKFKNIIPVG